MPLTDQERSRLRSPFKKRGHAVWTGELLEITYIPKDKEYRRPGKRGVVKGFTRAARLRMLRTIASINWGNVRKGLFITLTYPPGYEQRPSGEKSTDKYLMLRYMEKHLGKKFGAIWRLEYEDKKSGKTKGQIGAHWHLIVFGVSYFEKATLDSFWQLVLRADGDVVTWVKKIDNGKKLARYVGKYCAAKCEDRLLDNATYLNIQGRHWGIHRRDLVPFFPRFVIPFLTEKDVNLAENLACMKFRFFTRGADQGFQIFGRDALKIGEILFQRMLDIENDTG
jgi:hypothetical protein